MEEYTHEDMNKEVRSISGYYQYLEEAMLTFRGRDVLYMVGVGVVDNSCCGAGGCLFVRVPGYIVSWKDKTNEAGRPVSTVEPVTDDADRMQIRLLLEKKYPYAQINF